MLQTDSQYGVQANTIESTLRRLRGEPLDPKSYDAFRCQYALLPCKSDHHREFVLLCCALLPIPAYINGEQRHWDASDVLAHWNRDFYFLLRDVKEAFRALSLPLPERLQSKKVASPEKAALFAIKVDETEVHFNFHGRQTSFKSLKGIRYIVEVIKNQPQKISTHDLYYACNPAVHGGDDALPTDEDGLQSSFDAAPGSPSIDAKTRKAIQKKITELDERIEIARETGDREEVETLEEEREKYLQYLKSSITPSGQIAKFSSNNAKMAHAISQAISEAIRKHIEPQDEALARHIKNCLKRDNGFQYTPEPAINWRIS